MDWVTTSLSVALAITGFTLYFLASKIPPNPLVGFRAGYSYVSRRVWVRLNRVSALALIALAAVVFTLGCLYGSLAAALTSGIGSIVLVAALIPYAEAVAEKELIRSPAAGGRVTELKGLPPHPILVTLVVASALASLTYLAVTYPQLPPEIPTHFNIWLQPDSYGPKSDGAAAAATGVIVAISLTLLIYVLGWRKVEALYKPWFDQRVFHKVLNSVYLLLAVVTLMASLTPVTMIQYAISGSLPQIIVIALYSLIILAAALTIHVVWVSIRAYLRKRVSVG